MRRLNPFLLVLFLLAYVGISAMPAWNKVSQSKSGRDYATYHYAVAEALDGGDPYNTRALSKRARAEKTRKSVHPYFYPPPFLAVMTWANLVDLATGYRSFFWFNQLALFGCLAIFRRWFGAPWSLLGVMALSFTPITDNAKMGQANVLVMLAAVAGLWRGSGTLIGAAAMAKMSPALYLFAWASRRNWRPILAAVFFAIASSLVVLPLVNFDSQWRFYTDILPGFSSGHYHGLRVPIGLPANHSIPDLFHQYWPGSDPQTLSAPAQWGSKIVTFALLAVLTWVARIRRDALGDAGVFGACTVLLLITPVYTYEHHLVMALFPAAVVGTALLDGRLGRWGWVVALPAYFFTAWPLYWLRPAQDAVPSLHWWLQESKFIGLFTLGVLCVFTAIRSREAPVIASSESN
ncbi:MAG: glycosyltransferase 87 family protein [Myxococcota bacterium]